MGRSPEPDRSPRLLYEEDQPADARAAMRADEAAADEAAADEARRRFREQGIVPIEPDERIGVMLTPGERVVAVRRAASLERRKGWRDPAGGLDGDLYLTTCRLVHVGRAPIEYPLDEIREAVVGSGALRLVLAGARGVELGVADPRVLRVEIAAVREATRASAARDPGATVFPNEGGSGGRLAG